MALLGASQALAQVFSDKPIQYIIPFPPGGEVNVSHVPFKGTWQS